MIDCTRNATKMSSAVTNPRSGRQPVIRFKTHLRNTILDAMRSRGWKETDSESGEWEFNWADVFWVRETMDQYRLGDNQRVNHFRNHYELTRKDLTIKNLRRYKRVLEKGEKRDEADNYDFIPATFCLPNDFGIFEVEFKRCPNSVWIMKPPAKAQGKGIFLFTKLSDVAEWRRDYNKNGGTVRQTTYQQQGASAATAAAAAAAAAGGGVADADEKKKTVADAGCTAAEARAAATSGGGDIEPYLAQRYIDSPHLIGGKKYDMRVYCLVTSWNPLQAWLYRGAFCRFCHHRYSLDDIENTFIHVTNVAVQKLNPKYSLDAGCKWGIRMLKQYIAASSGDAVANKAMADIQGLIIKSLLAVQGVMMQDKHCFELYGYDILFDDKLKPWLVECNASPSLTAENPQDYHLKFNLCEDMLNVIDMEKRRRGDETRVGGFDLIWNANQAAGIVRETQNTPPGTLQSYLGCVNEFMIPISQLRFPPKIAAIAANNPSEMKPLM